MRKGDAEMGGGRLFLTGGMENVGAQGINPRLIVEAIHQPDRLADVSERLAAVAEQVIHCSAGISTVKDMHRVALLASVFEHAQGIGQSGRIVPVPVGECQVAHGHIVERAVGASLEHPDAFGETAERPQVIHPGADGQLAQPVIGRADAPHVVRTECLLERPLQIAGSGVVATEEKGRLPDVAASEYLVGGSAAPLLRTTEHLLRIAEAAIETVIDGRGADALAQPSDPPGQGRRTGIRLRTLPRLAASGRQKKPCGDKPHETRLERKTHIWAMISG